MHVEGTAYYVGHGAMNYMEVWDGNQLEAIIIVDAGSTHDGSGSNAAHNSKEDVKTKLKSSSVSIIMCLTHQHEDHYSYFYDLVRILSDEQREHCIIYIGGRRILQEDNNQHPMQDWILGLIYMGVSVIEIGNGKSTIDQQYILWDINDGEVILELIYNDYLASGKDENSQGAVFLLKNNSSGQAMLFTGDMTGLNFFLLNENGNEVCEYLAEIIQNYQVYMTVPHHGSRRSLTESNFMFEDGDNDIENFKEFFWEKLKAITKLKLLVSAGINDNHHHPRTCTLEALAGTLILAENFETDCFEAFESDNKKINGSFIDTQSFWATTKVIKNFWGSNITMPNNINFTL